MGDVQSAKTVKRVDETSVKEKSIEARFTPGCLEKCGYFRLGLFAYSISEQCLGHCWNLCKHVLLPVKCETI